MAAGRLKSVASRKWLALKPERYRPIPHRTSQTSRFPPMKKAALILLLSTATALAGPVACSSGTDSSSATYTLGTELGINKAAMDTSVKPGNDFRSEEHTSELQSLMRISYAVFCLKKKKQHTFIILPNIYSTNETHTTFTHYTDPVPR